MTTVLLLLGLRWLPKRDEQDCAARAAFDGHRAGDFVIWRWPRARAWRLFPTSS